MKNCKSDLLSCELSHQSIFHIVVICIIYVVQLAVSFEKIRELLGQAKSLVCSCYHTIGIVTMTGEISNCTKRALSVFLAHYLLKIFTNKLVFSLPLHNRSFDPGTVNIAIYKLRAVRFQVIIKIELVCGVTFQILELKIEIIIESV
ncbi:hypothetical protein SDC9_134442 [bioreactor metagenome]|uniref:Uncharacterized protein n=1 Tax=bioreactor metagenome TaxID=1076179 RepID=A0A645DD98_9ZZZZ